MPATSTSFGDGQWGIGADQTGMVLESLTYSYVNDKKEIKNRTGNTTGITYYNERVDVGLKGKISGSSPFAGTIASTLTLGNPLSAYLKGGVSGLVLIEEITLEKNAEDYTSIDLKAVLYPNITS